MPPLDSIYPILKDFGFPVAMVGCLMFFIATRGKDITATVDRLTRIIALVVLAMQFAPQFHSSAEEIYEESLRASRKRKDDGIDEELARRDSHTKQ